MFAGVSKAGVFVLGAIYPRETKRDTGTSSLLLGVAYAEDDRHYRHRDGRATAGKFAAEGWSVVATVRKEPDLKAHAGLRCVKTGYYRMGPLEGTSSEQVRSNGPERGVRRKENRNEDRGRWPGCRG